MTKTWIISDPHFGHQGVCNFTESDGVTPLRPWNDPEEMNEALVENWNSVVNDADRVYLLGDICMRKKHLPILNRLKGRKVLVRGNHDVEKLSVYAQYFDDVRAYVIKKGLICSHIPIHPNQMNRWEICAHGHMHSNIVLLPDGTPDTRYINVCVEKINYTPLDMQIVYDIVHKRLKEREHLLSQ
jgi:calcineurin-like phosphoesterase family protein